MPKISPLDAWLSRRDPLDTFIDLRDRKPNQEFGAFVGIDVAVPAHESVYLEAESLEQSWISVHNYVDRCLEIIEADEPLLLDREEADLIREQLGDPPRSCYPLYFISVGHQADERLVYVGKTSASSGRFRGGHRAISQLTARQYDGLAKTVYLGLVMLIDSDKCYLPLEWVIPLQSAQGVLSSIESQLIFHYKPELNKLGKMRDITTWPTVLAIENHSQSSEFLHGDFCFPPKS